MSDGALSTAIRTACCLCPKASLPVTETFLRIQQQGTRKQDQTALLSQQTQRDAYLRLWLCFPVT